MFTNLLNTLFGAHKHTDLARSAQTRLKEWLAPIDVAAPTGEDPDYDDDFIAIKEEVPKFSDINSTLIIEAAERLLKSRSKDVRVAAYYVYGRMRRDGAEGVAEGFELLSALVERFGQMLRPERAVKRRMAFEWMCSGTFTNRLDQVENLTGETLERTLSALALIIECTHDWSEDARPALEPLLQRFEGYVEALNAAAKNPVAAAEPSVLSSSSTSPVEVTSTRELLEQARLMAKFLRGQPGGYLAAYRLLRCVRWDTLAEVPPHETDGKTRLPAPRAELRADLRNLLQQKQWPELLERVEVAFSEGANHFWLDLQYYAFTAQEQLGGNYAKMIEIVATDCALILERLPGIERLAFNDGLSFADDVTQEWIARYATVHVIERNENATFGSMVGLAVTDSDYWEEIRNQAARLSGQQGLNAALLWLQQLPARDEAQPGGERGHFQRQMVMASVAEQSSRAEIALHLLDALDANIERFQLARWEPSLAFEAKHRLLNLLLARANRKDVDRAALVERIDKLAAELTAINPARAVTLSNTGLKA